MCHKIKILAKEKNGELTICTECSHYHLTFNNIFFEFNKEELDQFKKYLFEIDLDYWEYYYPCPKFKKNIPVPTLQKNLILLFNREEIVELKRLLSFHSYDKYRELKLDEIDYTFILN